MHATTRTSELYDSGIRSNGAFLSRIMSIITITCQ